MSTWPTYWISAIARARRVLRRYQGLRGGWRCEARRHEALVALPGHVDLPFEVHRRVFMVAESEAIATIDAACWPTSCSSPTCPGATEDGRPTGAAYVFADDDHADVLHERLGRREDTGEEVVYYAPPIGGVADHPYVDAAARLHEDGRCLAVWTLDGWWYLDVVGRAGERFRRSEENGRFSVEQVAGPAWRWSLKNGVLSDAGSGGGAASV